jgi:hypothetical protein
MLMKYLQFNDDNPLVVELHQREPQGPVDMVIPKTSKAESRFKMFTGYLYQVLPLFGATENFVKTFLRRSMDAGLAMEAPQCAYDADKQVLMTPCNAQQKSILSDVRSLPFFQDIDAIRQAEGAKKRGKKKEHTAPKMCFQIGSACSVQAVHGANDGKYSHVTKPGVNLGMGTQAFAATMSNAKKPAIKIDLIDDDASSNEKSEEGSDNLSSSDKTSASTSSDESEHSDGPTGSG